MSDALIDCFPQDGIEVGACVMQGRVSALRFARRHDRIAFVDRLFLGDAGDQGPPAPEFVAGPHRWRRRLALPEIGLVARVPTVLARLSAQENLGLVESRVRVGGPFWARVERALADTGLLAGVDLGARAGDLPWRRQVEINFLQMWLIEPECLMFDQLFDQPDALPLLHLPALFRRRFPLRAICHLQQGGVLPAALGVTDVIEVG